VELLVWLPRLTPQRANPKVPWMGSCGSIQTRTPAQGGDGGRRGGQLRYCVTLAYGCHRGEVGSGV
jgi:hypothetical protein